MTAAPRLLDQLVDLTAILDLELMEFSLLRTLNDFLRPQSLSLIHLDTKGRPRRELVYGDPKCSVRTENLQLLEETRLADEYLISSGDPQHVVRIQRGVLIIIGLLTTRSTRSYLQIYRNVELSKMDSHLVSGVLQIYRNFFNLLQHAQTDQLTGLANRKTFDESVSKVYELIPRENDPIPHERRNDLPKSYWLAMIDIDHFKSINDRFGHLYGDEVLVLLAQIIKASFREDDMMFRFGGEEFVGILRCPDQASCRTTMERFRVSVERTTFPQVGTMTVSLGVTQMVCETFIATLLDYADQALYHSKHNGRNQTTFFEDLLEQGLVKTEEITSGAKPC
ncbi:MAG TPA: GGDEF domain-containing protein [Spirochaetia bacterium]|nr:GGDEF domain-containing protein [Spirochaetia bacterium]